MHFSCVIPYYPVSDTTAGKGLSQGGSAAPRLGQEMLQDPTQLPTLGWQRCRHVLWASGLRFQGLGARDRLPSLI